MNRQQKQATVESLKNAFSTATIVIAAENKGVNADQSIKLRKLINTAGGLTTVAKNTLAVLGMQGSQYEVLSSFLKGPIILMYSSGDPIAIAKTVVNFAKENNTLDVASAAMGSNVLDFNGLKGLAELPSLEQLRGMLIAVIQAPASKVARAINTPAECIARVIKAYSESSN